MMRQLIVLTIVVTIGLLCWILMWNKLSQYMP
jgi:hypothetical protein